MNTKQKLSTNTIVKVGILSAVSFLLMLFDFPLPFFPPFLEIDASDLPAVIAAMSIGPVAGLLVQLIKNILNLFLSGTITGGVGEVANFLIGSLFVVPLGYVYRKNKSLKGYLIGAAAGTVFMSVFAAILNYTILIPIYAELFGGMETIIELSRAVNSSLSDLKALVLLGIIPFNLLKATAISILGYFAYKALQPIFNK